MIILNFNNLKNLNASLQIGDAVYAHPTDQQLGAYDEQAGFDNTGTNYFVGILRKIDNLGNNQYTLHVDDDPQTFPFGDGIPPNPNPYSGVYYTPAQDDFIMFSKFEQGDSGVLGYYAKARFVNDSKKKAELFAVSSEIIINSN